MRKRFPVTAFLSEFSFAQAEKQKLLTDNPEKRYQIRKSSRGFRVVERLETNEADFIQERRKPKKRKLGDTYGV